jgi:hypothetical protein
MSTENLPDDPTEMHQAIDNALFGGTKTTQKAQTAYDGIIKGWDLPETYIGDGQQGVPISRFKDSLYESHQENAFTEDETLAERLYGTKHPFMAASLTGPKYDKGDGVRDADSLVEHINSATAENERALIDEGIVGAAAPIEVDPMIVDIQRSNAPILDIIPSVAQPGFKAQYNLFTGRTLEDWYMSEADASDLSDNDASSFTLGTETKDMKIGATVLDVSDFSQRAMSSLDYMNVMDTTVGQVMRAIFLTKAQTWLYGDPDGGGTGLHESQYAHDGLASFAADAGQVVDKTGTTSGFLEDILDYITQQTQSSALTFGNTSVLVSPAFYNQIYDEVTPVVRLDGYDADVEYGPQGLAIGHERGSVPIRPVDGIRDYQASSSGVGSNSTTGDVFIYHEPSIQYRQLAPMSTVPLGALGLADRSAIFEYGTLVDKSLEPDSTDGLTHRLRYGSV